MDPAQLEAFLTAQTRRQGGGVSAEQGAVLSRFWKTQRLRVRERLLAQSRWEPSLRGLAWRVDLPTASSQGDPSAHSGPVALVELELARAAQVRPEKPKTLRGFWCKPSCSFLVRNRSLCVWSWMKPALATC